MATWSPSTVSAPPETFTSKGGYIQFEITNLRQSDGGTNQTYVDWKVTVRGQRYVNLSAVYVTLSGGKTGTVVLLNGIPSGSTYKTNWYSGDVLASGTTTFNNNDDGSISLSCYIKQLFYYGYTVSRWNNGTYCQTKTGTITVSSIARNFSSTPSISLSSRNETSIVYNWSTSENCSQITVNGSGTKSVTGTGGKSGTITITGLSAGTSYTHSGTFKRSDSGMTQNSNSATNSTYDYPKPTSVNNFTIGNGASVNLSNPLGRNVTLQILQVNTNTVLGTYSGTYNGVINAEFKTADAINRQYNSIPNSANGTYYAKVTYGSITKTHGNGTYSIDYNASKPTFDNFDYTDVNAYTVSLTGNNKKIIKGYSTLNVNISGSNKATGYKGATISKYKINGTQYNYADSFSQNINNYGTNPINVSAIDSRGNEKALSAYSFGSNWIDYFNPTKGNFSYERSNNGVGTQVTFKFNGTFWNNNFGSENNVIVCSYRFKKTNESNWTTGQTTITPTISGNNYSFTGVLKGDTQDNGFDIERSYNVEIFVNDRLSSAIFTYLVVEGSPAFDLFGNCISLGGMYNESLGGRVQINGQKYEGVDFKTIYPIGSVIMRWDTTDPSTLFPGTTWTRIQDGFLFCSKTTQVGGQGNLENGTAQTQAASGNTGSTTLSANQSGIRKHSHGLNDHTHSFSGTASGYFDIRHGNTSGTASVASGTNFTVTTGGGGATWSNGFSTSSYSHTIDRVSLSSTVSGTTGKASGSTAENSASNATEGHTHTLNSHKHLIPYTIVYVWRRTS